MTRPSENQYQDVLEFVLGHAKNKGVDEADAFLSVGRDFEVTIRGGQIEVLKQAVTTGLGLRVFNGKKLGFSHTNDLDRQSLPAFVDNTLAMSRFATMDEFNGLPENFRSAPQSEDENLNLVDRTLDQLTTEQKIEIARRIEESALSCDKRVKFVEGASVNDGDETVYLANTRGFYGTFRSTGSSLACAVVAEENQKKQVNYWFSGKRMFADHDSPESIGKKAAERTVRMLNARKVPSGKFPVVFEPMISSSFLGSLSAAVNGESVFRKMSFLADKLGESIGPDFLSIIDDGRLPKGLGSRPFDGEGVKTGTRQIVEKGVLKSFLYDSYTARKVKGASTGNAARTYTSTPHIAPLNFYVPAGEQSPDEIVRGIEEGFLVTGMIGFGVDTVTGQFSRGASGLWIRNGEPAFAVHEVTVASTMQEMLQNIDMIGNDLEWMGSVSCPTLRFREMTVGGS